MSLKPARERKTDADVKSVRQAGWVAALLGEVHEHSPNQPSATGSLHLEEELHARPNTRDRRRKPVVDLQRSEDKDARLAPAADSIANELTGIKKRHRTVAARDNR